MKKIVIPDGVKELIIRKGVAPNIQEPKPLCIVGILSAPADFYKTRSLTFDHHSAHLIISRSKREITLNIDEQSPVGTTVKGALVRSKEMTALAINSNQRWSPKDMASVMKKHRFLFPDTVEAMRIIADLNTFSAQIKTDVAKHQDTRGNTQNLVQTSVQTNVPLQVDVKIPLFNGQPPVRFKLDIELDVEASNVRCCFTSFEAFQMEEEMVNAAIDAEIEKFPKAFTIIEE